MNDEKVPSYPHKKPPPKPLNEKKRVIIALIVAILIDSVILTVLFVDFSGSDYGKTPRGNLIFTDTPNVPGRYTGSFGGAVSNNDIVLFLSDASLGKTAFVFKPKDGDMVQIQGGCNLTYYDWNENHIFDASDYIVFQDAATGDEVRVLYKYNGETIAIATIT
jgi:hypothetical protein